MRQGHSIECSVTSFITQKTISNKKYSIKSIPGGIVIAAIGKYALATLTQYKLADLFENTRLFTDSNSNNGYSCHRFHFRIDVSILNNSLHGTPEKKYTGDESGDLGGNIAQWGKIRKVGQYMKILFKLHKTSYAGVIYSFIYLEFSL